MNNLEKHLPWANGTSAEAPAFDADGVGQMLKTMLSYQERLEANLNNLTNMVKQLGARDDVRGPPNAGPGGNLFSPEKMAVTGGLKGISGNGWLRVPEEERYTECLPIPDVQCNGISDVSTACHSWTPSKPNKVMEQPKGPKTADTRDSKDRIPYMLNTEEDVVFQQQDNRRQLIDAFMRVKDWMEERPCDDDDGELLLQLPSQRIKEEDAQLTMLQKVDKIIDTWYFEVSFTMIILLDAVFMALSLEVTGQETGAEFSMPEAKTDINPGLEDFLLVAPYFTTALFAIELLARLAARFKRFHRSWWNWLDSFVVGCSLLEIVFVASASAMAQSNMVIFRILRMLRLARALRMLRMLSEFKELRALLKTIVGCVMPLLWSSCLLVAIQSATSMFLCQALQPTLADEGTSDELRVFIWTNFGTYGRAMYTVFEITFGGWQKVARPLVFDVSPYFIFFFVPYVLVILFAVMKIVTALFIKATMTVAAQEQEAERQIKHRKKGEAVKILLAEMKESDVSGDGLIDSSEFHALIKRPLVLDLMKEFDITRFEIRAVHDLLQTETGRISVEEFLVGVMQLHVDGVNCVEPAALMYEAQKMTASHRVLERRLVKLEEYQLAVMNRLEAMAEDHSSGELPAMAVLKQRTMPKEAAQEQMGEARRAVVNPDDCNLTFGPDVDGTRTQL